MASQVDPVQALAAKTAQSSAPQAAAQSDSQPDSQTAPASAAAANQDSDATTAVSDEAVAGSVNLLRLYSKLNNAITDLFDGLGVKRTATIPHQQGQPMADHITAVSKVVAGRGGFTNNFITASHTQHDPQGGSTVAHPSEKLRQTIIPKNNPLATKAIDACRTLVNRIASLLPATEPLVQTAKSQIALVGKVNGSGMTCFDLGAALIAIVHPLFLLLARKHQVVKHGVAHPTLTAPKPGLQQ
jgi:hypothetical protein